MKVINCEQGSDEWKQHKMGRPTASEFHKIITPGGKPSAQAPQLAYRLATEILLGQCYDEQGRPIGDISNLPAIIRGKTLEPQAAADYEFETGWKTTKVGLLVTDDGRAGASPDRLIITGNDLKGGCEFKCPYPHTHLEYVVAGFGKDYIVQAQGQIWVGEFDFVDRVSYLPGAPSKRERTWRDEAWMKLFDTEMPKFYETLDRALEVARAAGEWVPMPVVTAADYIRPRGFQARERHDPSNAFNREFDPALVPDGGDFY
jgi:hypothetical protein